MTPLGSDIARVIELASSRQLASAPDDAERKRATETRTRLEALTRSEIPLDPALAAAVARRDYTRTRAVVAALGHVARSDARIMFLVGGVGTGKTFAGAAAIAECGRGKFTRATRLRHEVYPPGFDEKPADLRFGGVWILDDLGTEDASDQRWCEAWFDFVDTRQSFGKTIVTTNLAPDALRRRYGERVTDRLRQCARIVVCAGDSIRKTGKGWEP